MKSADDIGEVAPPAPRRRARRPSLTSEAFLDQAFELFVENGLERTSIDMITAQVGIAKRTVYQRYRDKDSLFKAALHRAIDRWIVPVERLRTLESDDLEQSLRAIGEVLVDNMLSPAGLSLLRLTNAESGRMPDMGAYAVKEGTQRTIDYLADLFRRRLSTGALDFASADDAAEAFLNLVVGGPANAAALGVEWEEGAVAHRTRYSIDLFLNGLREQAGVRTEARDDNGAVREENDRLKRMLADAMIRLDQVRNPA